MTGAGTAQYLEYVTLTNYGYMEYYPSGEGIELYLSGQFINAPGATFNATARSQTNLLFNTQSAALLFINQGNFIASLYPNFAFQIYSAFENRGTLSVIGGNFEMRGTGSSTHTGVFNHGTSSQIRFIAGTQTLQVGSVINNGNGIVFNGAATSIYGTFLVGGFQQLSGTTTLYVPFTTSQTINVQGGTLDFREDANLYGLTITGTGGAVDISGNFYQLNITNIFNWGGTNNVLSSGTGVSSRINLLPTCRSIMNGAGTAQYLQYITLYNYGYFEYYPTGEGIELYLNGQFVNAPGGIFNVSTRALTNTIFNTQSATLKFTNQGTILVDKHFAFAFQIFSSFDNTGIVAVNSGAFDLRQSGTHTGTFNHTVGSFIRFTAGTHSLGSTSIINYGDGISFDGATVTLSSTFRPTFFSMASL